MRIRKHIESARYVERHAREFVRRGGLWYAAIIAVASFALATTTPIIATNSNTQRGVVVAMSILAMTIILSNRYHQRFFTSTHTAALSIYVMMSLGMGILAQGWHYPNRLDVLIAGLYVGGLIVGATVALEVFVRGVLWVLDGYWSYADGKSTDDHLVNPTVE